MIYIVNSNNSFVSAASDRDCIEVVILQRLAINMVPDPIVISNTEGRIPSTALTPHFHKKTGTWPVYLIAEMYGGYGWT
jgi:hypothetical protein